MIYYVDRMEEGLVVLCDEQENILTLPRTALPAGVEPGSKLIQDEAGFTLDVAGTAARREQIRRLQEKLRRDL